MLLFVPPVCGSLLCFTFVACFFVSSEPASFMHSKEEVLCFVSSSFREEEGQQFPRRRLAASQKTYGVHNAYRILVVYSSAALRNPSALLVPCIDTQ